MPPLNMYQRFISLADSHSNYFSYDVVEAERFFSATAAYPIDRTALLFSGHYFGQTLMPDFILPFRSATDYKAGLPGIYGVDPIRPGPMFTWIVPFTFDQFGQIISYDPAYMREAMTDLSDVKSMRDIIAADRKYKQEEFSRLAAGASVTQLIIGTGDAPETAVFKHAINSKHIDMDKYKNRFIGGTYQNNKRMLSRSVDLDSENDPDNTATNSITIKKMVEMSHALDMNVYIIIDNSDPNVVNPMPGPIMIDVTNGDSASAVRIAGLPQVLGPVVVDEDETTDVEGLS